MRYAHAKAQPPITTRNFSISVLFSVFVFLFIVVNAAAHAAPAINARGGPAIEGYDPVAYFTDAKAVEGKKEFTYVWSRVPWRFNSAENRDAFRADPAKFAPQYGGFCAWAVSRGYTAKIDPEAWRVVDSKLYLNYSKSVQSQWLADVPGNIAKGDANWPGLKAEIEN